MMKKAVIIHKQILSQIKKYRIMYPNKFNNKAGKYLLLTSTFLLLVLGACADKKEESVVERKVEPVSYKTAEVQFIQPEYELSIPAELLPYEQVEVFAKVNGFVKSMNVDRGDRVKKGQLLAVLEAPEMNQKFLSDQSTEQKIYSDFVYAQQAYDRLVEASKTTGAVAAIELDRAKTAMGSAKSAHQASKAGTAHSSQLQQYLRITAPFDGIITQRNFSVGALSGAGGTVPLFTMAQSNKLRLTLSLPEKHAASVKEGMKANFTVSSQPGKTFEAVLSRTSGMLDGKDRSLTLEFDIENPSAELQGGDYAQVKLKLQRKNPSYWVNSKSVLKTQSGTFVMTLNDAEIKKIEVKEGIRLDTITEVFGGLAEKDMVLVQPKEEIKEGKIN